MRIALEGRGGLRVAWEEWGKFVRGGGGRNGQKRGRGDAWMHERKTKAAADEWKEGDDESVESDRFSRLTAWKQLHWKSREMSELLMRQSFSEASSARKRVNLGHTMVDYCLLID